ncbi:hypothetical protein PIROE2DRAFT_67755 [Piromyces sp. E2]|nr:hypothetical protein PIROE2DRAFT_67755 [Piromyces sp. E2]|eukprot:OUM58393.1 hypothetical protein PIROE2DRAFT_67755 [Piromyces sp. E2]
MENKYNKEWAKTHKTQGFIFFWGHHNKNNRVSKYCLSQWWPCKFVSNGYEYNCAEQYMMSEKAKLFEDEETFQLILKETSQKRIKELGRLVKNFNEKKWNENKTKIVVKGNLLKFSQNEDLKKFLIGTGNKILVEASPYDRIWGIGLKEDNPMVNDPIKWKGLNLLGFSLMEVRDLIKKDIT